MILLLVNLRTTVVSNNMNNSTTSGMSSGRDPMTAMELQPEVRNTPLSGNGVLGGPA